MSFKVRYNISILIIMFNRISYTIKFYIITFFLFSKLFICIFNTKHIKCVYIFRCNNCLRIKINFCFCLYSHKHTSRCRNTYIFICTPGHLLKPFTNFAYGSRNHVYVMNLSIHHCSCFVFFRGLCNYIKSLCVTISNCSNNTSCTYIQSKDKLFRNTFHIHFFYLDILCLTYHYGTPLIITIISILPNKLL